ncbi:hypothetical protein FNSP4_14590 [Fusobacterium nucleatum]|nr:hypothetical protein [Fusobacterium polymorphum]BEO91650.1 hypothetical protein FNCP4_08620 [Fusobacterium nucleatum]BEP03725.1 hypothetical protein FNSP4_14590 [Fusobacterium nucleatum]
MKIVQNIVDKLKDDWNSFWKLLKQRQDKTYLYLTIKEFIT